MSNPKKSDAGSENASPDTNETKPKEQRFHSVRGMQFPVVRSYFDPKRNAVLDVVKVTKKVPNRFGGPPSEVTVYRHIVCPDQSIQARYQRPVGRLEVTDV